MARLMFGGGLADWTMTADGTNDVFVTGNVQVTFWDARTGGTRYQDLQDTSGAAITSVTSSTGSDGNAVGQIPTFLGPDGVFEMWAQGGSGPRALMTAINLGSFVGPVRSQLEAHLSPAVANPHLTTLASLADVAGNTGAAADGQLLGATAGVWGPVTVPGVGGTVQITGDQTVAGTKTFEQQAAPAASRAVLRAAEGQSADVLQAYSSAAAGTGGVRVKTTWFNERGELRVSPAKADTNAVRIIGQPSQTAPVLEQVSSGGTVLSRMDSNGSWRAPNLGRSIVWNRAGNAAVGAQPFVWTNDTGVALAVRSVRVRVGTAPTGASLIVDINVNGTTIFTTQSGRPTITATGNNSGRVTGFNLSTIPDGATVTYDIDQVGSTVAGADLTVQVDVW